MSNQLLKHLSMKYCPRFGQVAVELGFIAESHLTEALGCQVHEELHGSGHRLLGKILYEQGRMSAGQIDQVMTETFKRMRAEQSC